MITKEGFIQASGIKPEKAKKLYDHLEERFGGDWDKAAEYLKTLDAYLQKHKH